MMYQEVNLLIPVDQFLDVLDICDEHLAEKREMFKSANALHTQEGVEHFSVFDYGRYVLGLIDKSSKVLVEAKSTSSFAAAEFMARTFLDEWTSILTWLLNTAVVIDAEEKAHFEAGFQVAIIDYQQIFYRLRSLFEFAYDLACTGQISRNDENVDSSK